MPYRVCSSLMTSTHQIPAALPPSSDQSPNQPCLQTLLMSLGGQSHLVENHWGRILIGILYLQGPNLNDSMNFLPFP